MMPTLAEDAVVAAWSWIGEQGAGRGKPSLSMRRGPPPRIIKLATVPTFSFAAIADGAQDSTGG